MNKVLLLSFVICFSVPLIAQYHDTVATKPEKDCYPQSIGSIFRKKDAPPKPAKSFTALVLPNISSNPANGLLLGVGGSLGWWFGPKETTHISGAGFTAAWTTKNQWIFFFKSNAYSKNDRLFMQGDWRYYVYSLPTYGLGTDYAYAEYYGFNPEEYGVERIRKGSTSPERKPFNIWRFSNFDFRFSKGFEILDLGFVWNLEFGIWNLRKCVYFRRKRRDVFRHEGDVAVGERLGRYFIAFAVG
jgi:hypothetical protein